MSLGDIVGQLLQQGMRGGGRDRLERTLGAEGLGGVGGLEDILGGLLGGQGGGAPRGTAAAGGLGGLLDLAAGALGGRSGGGGQTGGMGGLGDLAGVLLGGGATRSGGMGQGGGMAILGTLAVAAFKHWQRSQSASAAPAMPAMGAAELSALTAPQTERLILRAMISAAKADGEVDDDEIQRIVGKIDDDGVTAEEKQFIVDELRRPADLRALVAEVPDQLLAAEVYAASLLAIRLDTEAERSYLQNLAQLLQLDSRAVQRLHELTGVAQP